MVLEHRDDGDVPGAEVIEAPGPGDEIEASVPFLVKMTSRAEAALMSARTFSRAPSYPAVARSPRT